MTYLHILHRIRRLGTIIGVLGTESDGVRGCLANIAFSGIVPSPSMIQSISTDLECEALIIIGNAEGRLTHDILHCPFQVKHAGCLITPRELV